MKNLFDAANYPDGVPADLTAGGMWAWKHSEITSVYPTATYTLSFRFNQLNTPFATYEITAGKVSSEHVVSHTDTSDFDAGEYAWQAVITRDSDSAEIALDERGLVTILPDLGANPGNSASWVYRVLVAIRATIEGSASKEQSSYAIGGRSLALRTHTELLELEREFAKRWQREKDDINRKAGRSKGGRVLAQMSA